MLTKLLWSGFFLICFVCVNQKVVLPYMDEIFHVPQTLQYVNHDFITWDPKITTPPGLYALGLLAAKLWEPSLVVLRSVNLVGLTIILISQPIAVASFPLLAFYANLYYTDVWSTLLVLMALSRKNCTDKIASALFFASLWFRQTNVIWMGLAVALTAVGGYSTTIMDLMSVRCITNAMKRLFTVVSPLIYVVLGFCVAFLAVNGSITLGDKSNHAIAVHGAQILYFLMFLALFSAPLVTKWAIKDRGLLRYWYLAPIELAVIALIVKKSTIVHPFILSDNRHYTFYLWRRVITPQGGLCVLPVYWAAWRWFASTLQFNLLATWLYLGAVLAVLIPTPLFEPRYYILPYLVWRRFLLKQRTNKLESLWNLVLISATVGVFAVSTNHFMW